MSLKEIYTVTKRFPAQMTLIIANDFCCSVEPSSGQWCITDNVSFSLKVVVRLCKDHVLPVKI